MSDNDKPKKDKISIIIPDEAQTQEILESTPDKLEQELRKKRLSGTGFDEQDSGLRPKSITERLLNKGNAGRQESATPPIDEAAEKRRVKSVPQEEIDRQMKGFVNYLLDGHVRIIERHPVQSSILQGTVQEATQYEMTRDQGLKETPVFTLSASIRLSGLLDLHHEGPGAKQAVQENKTTLDFNQQRQPVVTLGRFDSYDSARGFLSHLDQYIMHILATKPVDGKKLQVANDGTPYFRMLGKDPDGTSHSYDYAHVLRDSTIVEAFHRVNLGSEFTFNEAVGRILRSVIEDIRFQPQTLRHEKNDTNSLQYIFGREVGSFEIYDLGPCDTALMTRTDFTGPRSDSDGKKAFEGPVTGISLMNQFIERLAHAAAERGLIDTQSLENYHDKIKQVRGIPLEDTPGLGLLSPFQPHFSGPGSMQ